MPFETTLKNQILGEVFGQTTIQPLGNLYVSLHSASPTVANEVGTGVGYARFVVQNTPSNWTTPANGSVSNSSVLEFGPCQNSSWPQVTHFGVWDASSSGNLLASGSLTTAKDIGTSDSASFAANSLTFTLT